MTHEQGPNVTDPGARALLAAAASATAAIDYLLCSVREGEAPNVDEIAHQLADALNCMLERYRPADLEVSAFHRAARDFLGLNQLDEAANEDEAVSAALAEISTGEPAE